MADPPDVSVLMPVGAARRYLAEAASSVLRQTLANLELILIDDAGAAGEAARLAGSDPRVKVISSPGSGICDALNAGVEMAGGRFLCRCDSDDVFPPDRLLLQTAWLTENQAFGAVCGGFQSMSSSGRTIETHTDAPREITAELQRAQTPVHFGTYLVRAEIFRQTCPFRRWFVTAEDIDFQLRLGERCRIWFDSAISYQYRLHDASITHTQASAARVFFEAAARRFQQQRRSGAADDLDRGVPPPVPIDASAPTGAASVAQAILQGAAWKAHRSGRKRRALFLGFRACLAQPGNAAAWKSLAAMAFKR